MTFTECWQGARAQTGLEKDRGTTAERGDLERRPQDPQSWLWSCLWINWHRLGSQLLLSQPAGPWGLPTGDSAVPLLVGGSVPWVRVSSPHTLTAPVSSTWQTPPLLRLLLTLRPWLRSPPRGRPPCSCGALGSSSQEPPHWSLPARPLVCLGTLQHSQVPGLRARQSCCRPLHRHDGPRWRRQTEPPCCSWDLKGGREQRR